MATFIHSELSSYASLPSLKRDFRPSTAPINTTPTTGIAQGTKLSAKVPYHSKAKCKQFYFGYILVQQSGLCFPGFQGPWFARKRQTAVGEKDAQGG